MSEKMKMLIVDDSPDNLLILSSIVREYLPTVEVFTASRADEGIQLASDEKIDVALIDVQMPGMNGIEMCRQLKSDLDSQNIALILLTAHSADPKFKAMGLEAGADDFINRPFDNMEFIARVKVMLRIKQAEDGLRQINEQLEKQVAAKIAEVQEKEERLRSLAENSREWVWEVDAQGVFTYSNEAVEILGYTAEDIIGKRGIVDLFHSDSSDGLNRALLERIVRKQSFREVIHKAQTKGAESVWLSTSGFPMPDTKGALSGYRGATIDVTWRKQAENLQSAQLRLIEYGISHTEHEFLLQLLTEAEALTESEVGFCHFIAEDQKTILLQTWSRNTTKKNCTVSEHRRHYPISQAGGWADCVHQRKPVVHNDYASLSHEKEFPEGHVPIVRQLVVPLIRGDKVKAVLGIGNKKTLYTPADVVTLQRLADVSWETIEHKQGDSERVLLQSAIESATEAIVITDKDAIIQYVNPAFEELTGYPREEAIGFNPRFLKGGRNKPSDYQDLWNTLLLGNPWYGRLVNKKKDGTFYTQEARISPVLNAAGETTNYVAVNNDITHALELEDQLRQKYKMEAVGVMAGGMAHNFNNNLSIILGNLELSKMKLPENREIGNFLDNAKIAVLRSRDLIKHVMSYSRLNGQDKASLNLSLLVDETLQLLRATIPTTINVEKQSSGKSSTLTIHADSSQLQECLINLCNNAMQAMDETGTLTISLQPEVLQKQDIPVHYGSLPGHYVKLSVTDTGHGMTQEVLDKIFDLFYTTKPVDEGTGVGLSTVQGIVKDHDGLIKVHSTLGIGTTFELFFPVIDQSQMIEVTPIKEKFAKGAEKILFVDDDEGLTILGEKILSEMGYQVTTMTDSSETLKLFAANPNHFDLLITDQTMPGLTGTELIRALKKINPDLRTIICTGYSSKLNEEEAKRQGIDAFCMKPIGFPELLQTVRRVVDGEKE